MRIGSVRKKLQSMLAEPLRGALDVHVTAYAKSSMDIGRAWLTFERAELYSVAIPRSYGQVTVGTCRHPGLETDWRGPELATALVGTWNVQVDEALAHADEYVRGFAVVDRRCGRRRLETLSASDPARFDELMVFVRRWAEGLDAEPPACPTCERPLVQSRSARAS